MTISIKYYFNKSIKLISTKKFNDSRGYFTEKYNKKNFKKNNINIDFVQENFSSSKFKYTLRGLHFQNEPYSQIKLISVLKGKIFDVVVDLRKNSKFYKKYKSFILKESDNLQLLIPKGFAHGFCTLENNTQILYKTSNFYSKNYEITIAWNDPEINIKWPFNNIKPIQSNKDKNASNISMFERRF
jgi:dTDP-4-dehydrorhamnose 3,5-epimerase|tara:strand:- start:41 stop:598 length:558 start_codon:yes stop_codon:yes gene_type:complete